MTEWPPAWQRAIDEAKACGDRGDVKGAIAVLVALSTGLEIHHACHWLGIAEIPDYREAKWVKHPYDGVPSYLDYKIYRPDAPESKACMVAWVRKWVPIAIAAHNAKTKAAAPSPPPVQKAKSAPAQLDLFGFAA